MERPDQSNRLLWAAAFIAVFAAENTWAQGEPAGAPTSAAAAVAEPPAEAETVNVSASRITITGYQQPTPVTVVGTEQIEREARVDIADMIRDLPSFGVSASPNNSQNQSLVTAGVGGLNLVSLRNLGFNRNLVLFDGQRVVTSSIQGGVDMSTIPSSLVQRVEVVTGGASAAWGSDAITGVVNIILNKQFTGVAAHLEDSDNWHNNHAERKAELTWGTKFADDRGHIILSGAYVDTPDEFYSYDISGFKYQRLVNNPAFVAGNGQPRLVVANNVGLAQATPGGLITGCTPAFTANCPLRGIYFTGPGASPERFNFGTISGGFYSSGGTLNVTEGDRGLVSAPSNGSTLFAYGSFKFTDSIRASIQLNRGKFDSTTNSWSDLKYGTVNILADNASLPTSIRTQMTALGINNFQLGTMNHIDGRVSLADQARDLGGVVTDNDRVLDRGVFTLDGKLGDNWSWNAYYQQGRSTTHITGVNNEQRAPYFLAVDAVTVTQANVGASGLPLGSIACRSTLTNPTNGCKPLNVFGTGNASQDAINYVTGVARNGGNTLRGVLNQKTASASMQGELPFGLPAGHLLTAFGLEYREEEGQQFASPAAQASTFQLGNFKNFYGKYHTKEGFVQLNVPLLKDTFVENLALDLAGRYTDYTTSGSVQTFKVGLTSQVIDDIRVRASYSRDIRAPSLYDLFNTGTPVTGTATDPNTGLGVTIFSTNRGNLNLVPERSTTKSVGVVITPRFVNNLSISIDYYDIGITDAISAYNGATILAQCKAGNQTFCANLVFDGPNGALSEIFIQPVNADSLTTSGLDIAADYRTFVGAGAINFSVLANYMFEQTINSLGTPFNYAGSVGNDSPYDGVPKLHGTVSSTYVLGPWSATAQARVVGKAHINNAFTAADIANNDIAAAYYLDLRSSYKITDAITLYGAVDNVLDHDPPVIPFTSSAGSGYETPFKDAIYDAFGRVWRVGVRAKF